MMDEVSFGGFGGSGGGGGGSSITPVLNYSALPNPVDVAGQFFWASESQGDKWIPNFIGGGTYYNSGMYYSNGVDYEYHETPFQASQAVVDAGTNNTQFVTAQTLSNAAKWNTKENVLTAGTNITIDRTNPLAPVISSTGGGGGESIITLNRPPNANDDNVTSHFVGQRWIDLSASPRSVYICRKNDTGAAEWEFINNPVDFRYVTIKIIQKLFDFPAPNINDEIVLLNNVIYIIDNPKLDILQYTLVFNTANQINGFGQNVSGITSTVAGTALNKKVNFRSNTNLFSNDLQLYFEAPHQRMWESLDDGTVPEGVSFELNRFNVLNFQAAGHGCELGYIKDIRQGFIGTFSVFNVESGFIFAGSWGGGFRVDNTIFINCTGVFFGSDPTDPVVFQRRMSSNANINVPLGSIGYDFPQSSFPNDGQYQLQNGNASGDGTYVTLWSGSHPSTYPEANFQNNTGIPNSFPGLEWVATSDTLINITAQNVWYKVEVQTAIVKNATWVSYALGEVTYNSLNPLDGEVITRLSATGKSNDIIEFKVVKEDALSMQEDLTPIPVPITLQGSTSQGRAENVTIPMTGFISKDDKTSIWLRNTSGTSNVTILSGINLILGQK